MAAPLPARSSWFLREQRELQRQHLHRRHRQGLQGPGAAGRHGSDVHHHQRLLHRSDRHDRLGDFDHNSGTGDTNASGDNSTTRATTTTTTTSGQFIAKTTKNGALNVIFNSGPNSNGQVSITAAAGASFGSTTIVVNCPTAITTGYAGGAAAGGGGLGGFLRPPNTGDGTLSNFQFTRRTPATPAWWRTGGANNTTIRGGVVHPGRWSDERVLALRQRRS